MTTENPELYPATKEERKRVYRIAIFGFLICEGVGIFFAIGVFKHYHSWGSVPLSETIPLYALSALLMAVGIISLVVNLIDPVPRDTKIRRATKCETKGECHENE